MVFPCNPNVFFKFERQQAIFIFNGKIAHDIVGSGDSYRTIAWHVDYIAGNVAVQRIEFSYGSVQEAAGLAGT